MQKPLKALVAIAAIVVAACNSPATNAPSGNTASQPAGTPVAPSTEAVNIFDSAYAPAAGTKGGQILIGDWQEANQFNPFYSGQVTEANVNSAVWASLVVPTSDYKYLPDLALEFPAPRLETSDPQDIPSSPTGQHQQHYHPPEPPRLPEGRPHRICAGRGRDAEMRLLGVPTDWPAALLVRRTPHPKGN